MDILPGTVQVCHVRSTRTVPSPGQWLCSPVRRPSCEDVALSAYLLWRCIEPSACRGGIFPRHFVQSRTSPCHSPRLLHWLISTLRPRDYLVLPLVLGCGLFESLSLWPVLHFVS